MDPETQKSRDVARMKYGRAIKKLAMKIESKDVAMIPKTIEQVEKTWSEFEDAETVFLVELSNNGKQEDVERHQNDLDNLENHKDTTVSKANKLLVNNQEHTSGRVEPLTAPVTGACNGSSEEKEKGDEKEVEKLRIQQEMETESRNDGEKEEAAGNERREEKGGWVKSARSAVENVVENVENVGEKISRTLGLIRVSKKQYDDYQLQIKEQLIGKWEENCNAKVFQGVQISRYTEFLDNFQKSTGIDDRIRADFENMEFSDRIDDKVKSFTCEGTDTGGKYGMYMALKRPDEASKLSSSHSHLIGFRIRLMWHTPCTPTMPHSLAARQRSRISTRFGWQKRLTMACTG